MPHQITPYSPSLSAASVSQVGGGMTGLGGGSVVLASGVSGGGPATLSAPLHHHHHHHPQQLPQQQAVPISVSAVAAAVPVSNNLQQPPGGQFQRLKVEDALSYLDQVKLRFGKQPHVYNDFLDIMKEFKSQSIDTPGVIARVSQLFRGHPELIVGFNTFLPPGYKIEVSTTIPGQHTTVVHTPQGTQQHFTSTPVMIQQQQSLPPQIQQQNVQAQHPPQQQTLHLQHQSTAIPVVSQSSLAQPSLQSITHQLQPAPALQAAQNVTMKTPAISLIHPLQRGSVLGIAGSLSMSNNSTAAADVVSSSATSILDRQAPDASLTQQTTSMLLSRQQQQGSPPSVSIQLPCNSASSQLMATGHQGSQVSLLNCSSLGAAQQPQQSSNNLLSTNTAPVNNQLRDAHCQPGMSAAAAAAINAGLHHHQPASQPVEFNHAINYVNKIKLRFQLQPDIYKQFLEILHTYQKEQRSMKEGSALQPRPGTLTEKEVYEKVAKLFENQEDLLQEFSQFLPDATNSTVAQAAVSEYYLDQCSRGGPLLPPGKGTVLDHLPCGGGGKKNSMLGCLSGSVVGIKSPLGNSGGTSPVSIASSLAVGASSPILSNMTSKNLTSPQQHSPAQMAPMGSSGHLYNNSSGGSSHLKRSNNASHAHQPPGKRIKLSYLKDVSAADAGKYATLAEYDFFDKVRKAIRHEETYNNFLRCITLFNEEVVSRTELIQLVQPFLNKFSDLFKWFKDFVSGTDAENMNNSDVIPSNVAKPERLAGDYSGEIDYSTLRRIGASYCALPDEWPQEKCSGRSKMCRDVLNDVWVSFPSWSEDATFVSSRKTTFEEYIYRCEDERFELDVVLETNLATMRVLEGVQRKLNRMSAESAARFTLDDCLGGSSPTIHQRAIRRIYGDKAPDIIDGLKKNPIVAVPLVLRRLKLKDEEWREAQKNFNKVWREQNEKYYYKSLDHQGINFKQNDVKMLRSKILLNDIENLFDERHDQAEDGEVATGPHITLQYPPEKFILDDASNLIIHHVRRQTAVHKEYKAKIKQLVRHFIPDLLFHTRQELSDDENNLEDEDEDEDMEDKTEDPPTSDDKSADRPAKDRECKQGSDSNSGHATKRKTRSNKNCSEISENPSKGLDDRGKKDNNSCNNVKDEDDNSEGNVGGEVSVSNNNDNNNSSPSRGHGNIHNNNNNTIQVKEENMKCVGSGGVNGLVADVDRVNIKLEDIKKEEHDDDTEASVVGGNYNSGEEYRLFLCNNNWYLFLRLHQLLCQRLYAIYLQAIQLAMQESKENTSRSQNTALMLRLKPKCEIPLKACYPAVLEMVRNLLDGHLDYNTYEDSLREIFTIHAYHAFTLDKVVSGAVRQLQHLVCDEAPAQCTSVYLAEGRRGGAGGSLASADARAPLELQYIRNMEKYLADENCFKIYSYKRRGTLTIELLDTDMDDSEENASGTGGNNAASSGEVATTTTTVTTTAVSSVSPTAGESSTWCSRGASPTLPSGVAEAQRWHEYVENYLSTYTLDSSLPAHLFEKAVFRMRNLASWRQTLKRSQDSSERSPAVHREDNTQCKFNLSNLKAVIVMNSDSCMYKKQALYRAKKCHGPVSVRKRSQFRRFHNSWVQKYVTDSASLATHNWFMGLSDGLRPNKTLLHIINKPSSPPFGSYNHYTFTILEPPSKNASASS
ncbi:paired amphipathic helix protein Sin3a isoform X2 [Hyalella azteca]|nr:paired amphipathic helix protein Sin3a isoform X2 [Hyalella azteca]